MSNANTPAAENLFKRPISPPPPINISRLTPNSTQRRRRRSAPPGLAHPQNRFNAIMARINALQGIAAAAIFFDNDADKIAQVKEYCGNIVTVTIPESHCINNSRTIKNTLLADPKTRNEINPATNLYFQLHEKNAVPHIFYDVKSGIRAHHIDRLKDWIVSTQHIADRYALFDWDRTLTMNEGVILPQSAQTLPNIAAAYRQHNVDVPDSDEERIYEDMSMYLAGGQKRLKMLRDAFSVLVDKGIHIVLLTNNGACVEPRQADYYKKLARKFIGHDDIEFICSATTKDPRSLKYTQRGNKGYAIARLPTYEAVCKGKKTVGGSGMRTGQQTRRRRHR